MVEASMREVSMRALWIMWWIQTRAPFSGSEPPPMPPLDEWPKELKERYESLCRKARELED
jgi:hypothetical protein